MDIPTSLTGADGTGLTSPTFTTSPMGGPKPGSLMSTVTALGGTQTGVEVNSASRPFTLTIEIDPVQGLPPLNSNTGIPTARVPRNRIRVRCRKGVDIVSGQPPQIAVFTAHAEVPAGADVVDPESVRSAWSAFVGLLKQRDNEIIDGLLAGSL